MCDQFAANGYFVMMPDLFDQCPVDINTPFEEFDVKAWFSGKSNPRGRANGTVEIDPIIERCIREMREKYGVKVSPGPCHEAAFHTSISNADCHQKLGSGGYCFGAKYVVRYLRPDLDQIDVGYLAHPSFVEEEELRKATGPVAISAAEHDHIFPANLRHKTEEILESMQLPYELTYVSRQSLSKVVTVIEDGD